MEDCVQDVKSQTCFGISVQGMTNCEVSQLFGGLCHRGVGLPVVCGSLPGCEVSKLFGGPCPWMYRFFVFFLKVEFHFCFVVISLSKGLNNVF